VIQEVEGFEPELELESFRNRCDLLGSKVEAHEVGPRRRPRPPLPYTSEEFGVAKAARFHPAKMFLGPLLGLAMMSQFHFEVSLSD